MTQAALSLDDFEQILHAAHTAERSLANALLRTS